jgi:MoxR-like ATPase
MTKIQETGDKVLANVERVIVGKHHEVRLALVALLCRGHLLIEDVPGTGKTVLAKAIARSLGCTFRRIQFTPDLLPSDVTGLSIYNQKTREFEFRPGPIMSQVVLADEINRATPKTQSALLEAMEERQATIDGETHPMPDPFLVIATQNPIEYEGTFALPEAQLDRFMIRLRLGYPQQIEEIVILDEQKRTHPLEELEEVLATDELRELQSNVREVYVDPTVADYIVRLVNGTRTHPDVYLGASPRGSIALYRAGQALAGLLGRDYVIPDDIKALAEPALAHRLIIKTMCRPRRSSASCSKRPRSTVSGPPAWAVRAKSARRAAPASASSPRRPNAGRRRGPTPPAPRHRRRSRRRCVFDRPPVPLLPPVPGDPGHRRVLRRGAPRAD